MGGFVSDFAAKIKPHALAFCALWNEWMTQFTFRAFLWYEFWQSGLEKLPVGDKSIFFMDVIDSMMEGNSRILRRFLENNWFANVSANFPGPIRMLPDDFIWLVVMFTELILSWLLLIGFSTRWVASILIFLSLMALYTVHFHYGYNVCDNGWKMPLIYLIMLLAILVQGPSKLSVDRFIVYWADSGKKK